MIFGISGMGKTIPFEIAKGMLRRQGLLLPDKYTNEGQINYGYSIKGNYLEFYVKDTGIGIKSDIQDKIFERFRQADLSATRPYEGAGLGLSISKSFVEMLGGKIWLESLDLQKPLNSYPLSCHRQPLVWKGCAIDLKTA